MKWNWKSLVSVGLALVIGIAVAGWSTAPNGSASKHSHGITVLAVGAGDVSAAAGSGLLEPSAYFGALVRWVAKQVRRTVNWVRRHCSIWWIGFSCDW